MDSNVTADFTCILGTTQKQTKKRHCAVQFTDHEGREMRVVTSLMDITAEEIASRWINHVGQLNRFFAGLSKAETYPCYLEQQKMRCSINYSQHLLPLFYSSFFTFKAVRKMAVNPYPP